MRYQYHLMLTNGKMARLLGIDPKTLRSWARKGVVHSYINLANGYRYYFQHEVLKDLKAHPGTSKKRIDLRRQRR